MKRSLFIRADGNETIGLGHIMRSMTIANEFRKRGYTCTFLSSAPVSKEIFDRYGFEVIEIGYPYDSKTDAEARQIAEILARNEAKYILVDSYHTNNGYLNILRNSAAMICINSTGKRLATDYLINENIACDRDYIEELYSGSGVRLLLGPEYTPIRDEFRGKSYQASPTVKKVLVTTGGGDQHNFMTELLRMIKAESLYKDIQFTFISGGCNIHYDELAWEAVGCGNVQIIQNSAKMAELMWESDMAVSAGGTTILELSVTGVPAIGMAVAGDQEAGLAFMGHIGMIKYVGRVTEKEFWHRFFTAFNEMLYSYACREKMSKKCRSYLDGNGAERIFHQITGE